MSRARSGEPYRGICLAALDSSTDHAFELNELEGAFVTESREASERDPKRVQRTNRRLRALLAGLAVVLAAAVAGGLFALIQRSKARDAETAQLAQRLGAQALVEEDLDVSLLLARQAVAIDDSPRPAATCSQPSSSGSEICSRRFLSESGRARPARRLSSAASVTSASACS